MNDIAEHVKRRGAPIGCPAMANLLRLIVGLVEDEEARQTFRADPSGALDGFDDLSGEDVAAAADLARVQVDPRIAERITDALGVRQPAADDPRSVAVASILALCDAADRAAMPTLEITRPGGEALPEAPPSARPGHLWAVDGSGDAEGDHDGPAPALAPVPDPPGGFEFGPLELVQLPEGIPEAGIEPGTLATVVAVHRDPELTYEIEVSSEDGGRRFLGTVPPSFLDRVRAT
jgi:hypothetical protein